MHAKVRDYDDITSFLGDFGRFQTAIWALMAVSAIPPGFMALSMVFLAYVPEHHCKPSMNFTGNATDSEVSFHEQSSWVGPDMCSRYKVIGDSSETAGLGNETEECVDGWVFSTERYSATIVSEWNLVCENAWKVPFSISTYYIGVLIGSFISGQLSDRFGRKPVFFWAMAIMTISALIQAASVSWVMFCVINCVRGVAQISNYITSLVLASEILSQSARVTFSMLGHSLFFAIGYACLPLFAYLIQGWRMLLVVSAIPGLLYIPVWWVIPESPRWLLQRGRVADAERVIRNAAKKNRVPTPEVIFTPDECLELMQQTYNVLDLVRTTNMRNITILNVFLWAAITMVFYGLSLNTSNMRGNAYLNSFFSAAIDIVASVAVWLITLLIIKLVPEDMPVMSQVFALLGKLGVSGAYSSIYLIATELFPTVVRNMGLGVASTAARVGSIISPYVVYLGVYSKILPYIVFGAISLIAAAVSFLLPDTTNSKLPDHISQVKPIRGYVTYVIQNVPNPKVT
uniref:Major facilitator superfamily (MFS) profile domain-containing protein n=1 Tax=Myripristis murdjan TaxID=586833 RepID=A0A667WFU3_9TELE